MNIVSSEKLNSFGWPKLPDWMRLVPNNEFPVGTSLVDELSDPVWLKNGDAVQQIGVTTGAVIVVRVGRDIGVTFAMPSGISRDFVKECAAKYDPEGDFDVLVFGGAQGLNGNTMNKTITEAFREFGIMPMPSFRPTPKDKSMIIGIAKEGDVIALNIETQKLFTEEEA